MDELKRMTEPPLGLHRDDVGDDSMDTLGPIVPPLHDPPPPPDEPGEEATANVLRRFSIKPQKIGQAKKQVETDPSVLSAKHEEVFSLGYIPMESFSANISSALAKAKKEKTEISSIDFSKQGYITDALIKTMVQSLGKTGLSHIKRISLEGCSIVTDVGLHWLVEGLTGNKNNIIVNINGCSKVGDGGLASLVKCPTIGTVQAMATNVTHLSGAANTKGSPLFVSSQSASSKKPITKKEGHLLVVPLSTKHSLSSCLQSGKTEVRQPFHHVTDVAVKDWKVNITEVERSHVLFAPSTPPNPVHAILPFDPSADLEVLRKSVTDSIAHVLSKELINPRVKRNKKVTTSSQGFMDCYFWHKCSFGQDGVFRNTSDTPGVVGAVFSRQPLSRTNPHFEVQCLVSREDTGLVLGALFDILYTDRFPLDSKERNGGAVDGFELEEGAVIGFGIKGGWDSEYVPSEGSSYYFTKNGEEVEDKKVSQQPHIGMYPMLSMMGKNFAAVQLANMAHPPEPLKNEWEENEKWWTPGYAYNCLYDDDGVVSCMKNYKNAGDIGLFFCQESITRSQNTFTITILKQPPGAIVTMGICKEDYSLTRQPGWDKGSIGFHGDNGKFYLEQGSGDSPSNGTATPWKEGDEIKAVVRDFGEEETIQPNDTVVVDFFHRSKLVHTVSMKIDGKKGIRFVFVLSLRSDMTQVKVHNFRQKYFPPPPRMDMLTMGRSNFLNIYDDGRAAHRRFDKRDLFSTFISKTPFNKQLTYFEVKVKHLGGDRHGAVGFAHAHYLINNMIGWLPGSVGYHADNGFIYDNNPQGSRATVDDPTYKTGDVVGCGFEPQGVDFTPDGIIKPQQTIKFYFTKNGRRIHEANHRLLTDGVYPALNLHFEPDELILENYYCGAESGQITLQNDKAKVVGNAMETDDFVEGCQFTLVAMGTEQGTSGKVQLLNQMVKDGTFEFPTLKKIEEHIQRMERETALMDLQGQQLYGQLCWQRECLNRFSSNIGSRLKVMALDELSGKGRDQLMDRIESVFEGDLDNHQHLYNLQPIVHDSLEKILHQVKTEKMVASSSVNVPDFTRNTRVYEQAVRFLQTKGNVIWVPMKRTVIALDINFAKTLVKMSSSTPGTASGMMAPCIGSETKVWNSLEEICPELKDLSVKKRELLNSVLLVLGVIEVPRLRVKHEDPPYCYCTLSTIGSSPVKMTDFQSERDVVLVSREYNFLYTCSSYIFSMVISRCLHFSRPVVLSTDWAVFQSGATQTLIYIHNGCNLRVETRCYMPSTESERLDFDTRFYVEEYSFNIFCIFIDIIDLIITRLRIKVTFTQNVPRNLVNSSIGCVHDWGLSDEEFRQTVCTLCNQCTNKGRLCPYNGLGGAYKHQCGCNTLVTGCRDCGICQTCAETLWTIRSYLRPNLEVSSHDSMQSNGMLPLNATTYDELEFTNLGVKQVAVCLTAKGTITKMFPGEATEFPSQKSLEDHMSALPTLKGDSQKLWRFSQGDTVTVRLDPIKRDSKQVVVVEDDSPLEVTPVYFTAICRECTVWHDTGIVAYTTTSTLVPVGQFIGAVPLSKECPSFSFEIINFGEHGYIAIGVCPKRYTPDRQPGWNTGSIGYHADDGGIFLGAGYPSARKDKCVAGDIMKCRIDFEGQKIEFYKNGTMVYSTSRLRRMGDYHAAVGFHSVGEAVRLLEKEPWQMAAETEPTPPSAFDAYKYGNMHISPGRTLSLKKVRRDLRSWLMIHNPSKAKIGYKIIPTDMVSEPIGILEPSAVKAFHLRLQAESVRANVDLHWFLLESTRDYSLEDLTDIYDHTTAESLLKHRLKIKVTDVQSTDSRPLKQSTEEPDATDCYLAEVFKNGILVASYWLTDGNYVCSLPQKSDVLVRYPKFPTLDQPNGFQKGMRVIVDLTKTQKELYAEAVIEEATPDGYLRLEYSEEGQTINSCMEAKITSPEISIKEIEYEEAVEKAEGLDLPDNANKKEPKDTKVEKVAALNLLSFQSRGHLAVTKRAYQYPPFHLLTEASRAAINSIDESWRTNTLSSVAKCKNVPTRLTVQELQISGLVGNNLEWLMGKSKSRGDKAFAFLPANLGLRQLCYPMVGDMFTNVDVHTLCFYWLEMGQKLRPFSEDSDEITLEPPLHFLDLAPAKPDEGSLTPEVMYTCLFNGWTYSSLYSNKLCLPSTANMFQDEGITGLTRAELEYLMGSLLRIYAAQCHIFAEQHGGIQFQSSFEERTLEILQAIEKVSKMLEPSCCYAHSRSLGLEIDNEQATLKEFSKDEYRPYEETIHVLDQKYPALTSLPPDFFQFFKNIKYVGLTDCPTLKQLPEGLSKCDRLKVISIKQSGVQTLPADLFKAPDLSRVHCIALPVKTIPTSIAANCQLTELVLARMLLTDVPKEIGQLTQLGYLDLSGNPLVTLPMEMKELTKLKTLILSGIPWLVVEGHTNGVSFEDYEQFLANNPSLTSIISKEKLVAMFHENDHNKNQRLDATEAVALNMHIFWQVPRLGSTCISDSDYGGIPPVIFLLSSLETLRLNFQALTAVPVHMCRLLNLRNLSVSNNPLLESLPGALGHLPNLKSLRLMSNPSLRTPPHEVVSRGFASTKAYLKRLAGGFTECRRTKLMLVGLGGAGKTSLLRALMSNNKKTAGTKGEDITNGIDILPWTVKSQDNIEITYNTWDFAGQTLYYNTHQFFLSKRAVYLLLWSTRQGFEHAGLEFWLSSIASHAPKTPIFVVGTHCDQVPKADIPIEDLTEKFPQIVGFHFVSSIEGKGIAELERDLLKVTLEQKNMGEKVPKVWLNMEKKILAARQKTSILPWKTIQAFGMEVGIYDEKDIREAVQFLHELGTVQYFDNEFLREQVVINPQWIVDVMSCVVSVKNSPIQEHQGRFLHKYIPDIWSEYPRELHMWLLQLTEEFDLTFPLPEDNVNIVPCLLPQEVPKELNWPVADISKNVKETKLIYKFTYLPAGLFNRAQVRLFQLSDGRLIWKRGSLLKKNKHKALISQTSDFELQVKVQGPRPENVIFLIHEIFESLIKESFHGVVCEFLVPCPDCIVKEGTLDPSMFEESLVTRARELKAPFLQCRKYFHTISMAQLYEVMPSDGTSDFDAHLQNSLVVMQQLTSDLSTDVAIIYSSEDVADEKDSVRISPQKIKHDLEAAGFSCWFSNDMSGTGTQVEEIMLALKNCRVVVALVSDNFESDNITHDLFLYTLDTLNKDFVVVVIGDSTKWRETGLGMRIGGGEEMVMFKNKSRYTPERVQTMIKVVNGKLSSNQPQIKAPPSVFISYSWSNSRKAQAQGTKCREGAIGWGDPRDIKEELESRGLTCWLDVDQGAQGKGLFKNIVDGIRNSQVLVAFISDEYVESDNTMMELRFGILTMNLPTVIVVVGTGKEWKQSEAGMLITRSKASKVYFQHENPDGYDILERYIRERLSENADKLVQKQAQTALRSIQQREKHKEQKKKHSDNSLIQEESELMQRKFMRHIISFVSTMDQQPTPRLLVIDFESPVTTVPTPSIQMQGIPEAQESSLSSVRSMSKRRTLRPKTANRSRNIMSVVMEDKDNTWETEASFCLKMLCEYEKGWHMCKTYFPVKMNEEMKETIKGCSAYLARMYAILRQSSVNLNCFEGVVGHSFVSWVEQNAVDNVNFLDSYIHLRSKLVDDDAAQNFLGQLERFHLPTGKIFWLCKEHSKGPRITKLPTEGTTSSEVGRVLFEEDVKLREALVQSPLYAQRKAARCPAAGVKLPAMETTQTDLDVETDTILSALTIPNPTPRPVEEKPANNNNNNAKKPPPSSNVASKGPPLPGPGANNSKGAAPAKAAENRPASGRKQSAVSLKTTATAVKNVTSAASSEKGSKTCVLQ